MSSPSEHMEDLAALHALGLLDEADRRELFEAAQRDPEIDALMRDFTDSAALLAFEAPEVKPPPELRQAILDQLPARAAKSKIVSFSYLLPYAIAACLMILGIYQARHVASLDKRLAAAKAQARQFAASDAYQGLHLATLEAKDASYTAAKILVAWDPNRNRGVVSLEGLPAAPSDRDYQLWVLDPGAAAPVSAGVINASRPFNVPPVSTGSPGFAISLEPRGGVPAPTGPILFAVAPGP